MSKKELIEGLKGVQKQIKTPNKYLTETSYKKGLKKAIPNNPESE